MSTPDFDGWVCPVPLRNHPQIVMGHGGGGHMSRELLQNLIVPAYTNDILASGGDAATLHLNGHGNGGRLAMSTDSFVVQPLYFPGGSIAELAVHGTVNDLAMQGAVAHYLSVALIIEEGLQMAMLADLMQRLGRAAEAAGVQIVTGDTKVVEHGHGDGLFINTTGIGFIPAGVDLSAHNVRAGDAVIVSGTIGDHGMAILSQREGLQFDSEIESDSAALHPLVARMLEVCPTLHALRDPTRGGVASTLNEMAADAKLGIEIEEAALPVRPAVKSACEILGMDPLYVANEGKLVAFVPSDEADALLAAMREHPLGADSRRIGSVVAEHPGVVVARTPFGATRVVDMAVGEQLPRIC